VEAGVSVIERQWLEQQGLLESDGPMWQSSRMDRGAVIETLRRHESELKAAGVVHLRLFGSVARGEPIDLVADPDPARRLTLVSMARLENMLSDLLKAQVDLAISSTMREPVRARAEREAVLAF